jgi:hypothetical protein
MADRDGTAIAHRRFCRVCLSAPPLNADGLPRRKKIRLLTGFFEDWWA